MDRELRRGTLEMLLLKLLEERDRYGYELITALDERTDGAFAIADGTLYPVLYRLEEAGRVEPYWETRDRGVPRKYYRITDEGREELGRLREVWRGYVSAVERLMESEEGRES
ncbi:MAG: PadR family transcriptional regulator [Gemmatimonadota bacterium]